MTASLKYELLYLFIRHFVLHIELLSSSEIEKITLHGHIDISTTGRNIKTHELLCALILVTTSCGQVMCTLFPLATLNQVESISTSLPCTKRQFHTIHGNNIKLAKSRHFVSLTVWVAPTSIC